MPVVRRTAFAVLAGFPIAAHAGSYLVVCSPATCVASDGTTQPAGTALARIVWDGVTPYAPSDGAGATADVALIADDGRALYTPAVPHPNVITADAFLSRFAATEQAAVQQAAISNATIALGLTMGLATGTIDLTGCPSACTNAALLSWMNGLVTAGAITSARETAILTP